MFTGIVQNVGTVAGLKKRGGGARLEVKTTATALRGLGLGASIAVNGCCLTVIAKRGGTFGADLTPETLARTSLGGFRAGDRVNLEAPLRVGDALSGHLLQGHVEGTGRLLELAPAGAANADAGWWLAVEVPAELRRYLAPKGSLAVDGISLTIAELRAEQVRIAIIPFTYQHTHLARLRPGAAMNLETDPMARHLERLLQAREATGAPALRLRELRRQGF